VFTPPGAGAVSGSLSIPHNGTGSPDTVSLNGTGTVPAISPIATNLAFDNVQLGVPRAATPLVVTNTGNASLVFATNPTSPAALSGPGAADYSVASTCNPASPLAPSATCTITVTFTPSVLGSRTATLTVNSDASNGPLVVNLGGTGVALPEPVVTGPGGDFADTVIGQTSASTRTVTLLNNRTLSIGYSLTVGGDFLITAESCGTRVVPGGGGSCTVTLAFRPVLGSGEGPRGATVPISFTGTGGNPNPSPVNISLAGRALLPIALSTGSLGFSAVVGSPTTSTVVVTNRSSAAITLSTLSFSGAAAADYSVDGSSACTAGGSIAAGASCNLVLRFNPPAAGARNATLTLAHSGLGSPQTLNLVGTAIPAPQGRIEVSAFSLAFPDTQLGSASPVQTLTVRNSGDLALTFSAFNLGGAAAADYERAGSCSTAAALAIGAECTVSLAFRPGALGARAASLTVVSDASNGPATVTLSGTGIPVPVPVVSLSATSVDFGAQTVGGLYPARSVRLSNTGTANLTPTIAVVGAGYLLNAASPCPGTLAPGAACDIELRFAPTAANTDYPAVLRVTSNAAGSPHDVALSGRGTAVVVPVLAWQASVTQLSFGNVSAGSVSAAQSATLVNQGPGGVTVALVNTVGADAAGFVVTGGTCAAGQVLFEGQSCRVDVAFAPAFAGAKTAQLQVATDGSPPPAFGLQGTGLSGPAAAWRLSATTIDFPATRIATRSNPLELILSSTGSTSLRVTAVAVDGPFTIQDSTCPAAPFSLPAGAQCALRLVFAPATTGSAVGQLRVSTDAATASADVRLNGQGEPAADVSSGGGCSMIDGDRPLLDPMLWLLAALSALVLWRRRAQRQAAKTPR
jgi:trimeric autotransporter adhesin